MLVLFFKWLVFRINCAHPPTLIGPLVTWLEVSCTLKYQSKYFMNLSFLMFQKGLTCHDVALICSINRYVSTLLLSKGGHTVAATFVTDVMMSLIQSMHLSVHLYNIHISLHKKSLRWVITHLLLMLQTDESFLEPSSLSAFCHNTLFAGWLSSCLLTFRQLFLLQIFYNCMFRYSNVALAY